MMINKTHHYRDEKNHYGNYLKNSPFFGMQNLYFLQIEFFFHILT